ncbi:MAG TPA: lysozyme [Edaphobacter sp.]
MANFKYSTNGLNLTKQAEGVRLTAYQDSVGVWTIGYGHTGSDVKKGLTITEDQATTLLEADVAWAVTCVNKSVSAAINQNQFDALVDFVFNLGCANFGQSTLLRLLNEDQFEGASEEFPKWNKAKKKVLPGLTKRRAAEQALFNTPVKDGATANLIQAHAAGMRPTAASGRPPKKAAKKGRKAGASPKKKSAF